MSDGHSSDFAHGVVLGFCIVVIVAYIVLTLMGVEINP